jgi:membrane-associated protease RseP (regulator of RpoE activity)
MFNEPASSIDDDHVIVRRQDTLFAEEEEFVAQDSLYSEIYEAVERVLMIDSQDFALEGDTEKERRNLFLISEDSQLLMSFKGQLRLDSELAYEQLDALFAPHDLLPIFRERPANAPDDPPHQIYVVQGRVQPNEGGGWLALILFSLTVLSVLLVGSLMAAGNTLNQMELADYNVLANLWRGLPYATGILLILGAHEMGHYIAARRNNTAASLPYFLPFPFGLFGTFGAAIRLREPMRNRKILLDIGAAGPLAGLIFAIPILLIGLATSEVGQTQGGLVEGNSILYAVSKLIVFGEFLPSGGRDVFVNQLAWAGWTGLLVTGLNLIPVGQLDGGHILYALFGRFAKILYYPVVGGLVLLTLTLAPELLIFAVLILFMGNLHAVPLDDITRLDDRRRGVAIFALVVFALVFVPMPLQISPPPVDNGPIDDAGVVMLLPAVLIVLTQRVLAWRSA